MIRRTVSSLILIACLAISALGALTPARAAGVPGAPVAIVEDVEAPGAKVGFMEYLEVGRTIRLGSNGRIVIGYLHSCLNEVITGGTVTIGQEQSTAKGGKVERERVECDGGQMKLSAAQAGKAGVVVMRNAPRSTATAMATPDFRIFSTRPIITLSSGAAAIRFTRLDRPSPPLQIHAEGRVVDMAKGHKKLAIGGLYRAEAGDRSVVFSVDAFALDGTGAKAGPIVSRLIRL